MLKKFNPTLTKWEADSTQPSGVRWDLAIDQQGNPAYVDKNERILWKRAGKWTRMKGCAVRIAFGPEGSFYKRGCFAEGNNIFKYNSGKRTWDPLPKQMAEDIVIDSEGTPWINTWAGEVYRLSGGAWVKMGLRGAAPLAAGPEGGLYALAAPVINGDKTIYRWAGATSWVPIKGRGATELSIGINKKWYVVDSQQKIFRYFNPNCVERTVPFYKVDEV